MRALRHMRQWRDAGVPLGCRTRDGPAPRTAVNASMSPPRESGSGFDALAFDGAVDRRAADAEELGDFEGAVLATVYQRDQVRLLATVELGLFATQPTLGLGDLHALDRAKPDQVGLELSHHRQDVEQQPPDRVARVVDRAAEREADLPRGELVGDRPGIGQRPRQTV